MSVSSRQENRNYMDIETPAKSWFCVLNNPLDHGYSGSPQEIIEEMRNRWATKDSRCGAWAYCISVNNLHHVHFIVEDSTPFRFGTVKNMFPEAHIEVTRGYKDEAESYINKVGKYAEKGETVLCTVTLGEIRGRQGQRTDLDTIGGMINDGMTPKEILNSNFRYYKYEGMIRQAYYAKRDLDTPIVRPVQVFWHIGESGSGKSASRLHLASEVGEDNIFYCSDLQHPFDGYNGQRYVWIEDLKGEIRFGDLLRITDVYKADIPARYHSVKALWNEVHITSVFTPRGCYHNVTDEFIDRINQLERRITAVIYHAKLAGSYYSVVCPRSDLALDQYKSYFDAHESEWLCYPFFGGVE